MGIGGNIIQSESRYTRGKQLLATLENNPEGSVLDSIAQFCPDLARMVVEFGYGEVYSRPGLTAIERQLVTIAALGALGNAPEQLRFHIGGALNVGCQPEKIIETCIHLSIYAGFPASLNAMTVAREVFTQRGENYLPVKHQTKPEERFAVGLSLLEEVNGSGGAAVIDSLNDIAPDLGRFIVEYSYGDIYSRNVLSLKERELATIAACAALGTCAPQLKVHFHGFLNVGGTKDEAIEAIIHLSGYAGFPAALNALGILREALEE